MTIHAGQLIECVLHEQGRTVTWFAAQLCCTRPNVYKIFRRENIDIQLLWRISCILKHNFFQDLANAVNAGSVPASRTASASAAPFPVSKEDTIM